MVFTKTEPIKELSEKKESKSFSIGNVATQTTEAIIDKDGNALTINEALALILNEIQTIKKAVV